ncbi:hypothetical protein GCM10010412_088790 [Nonomuraea recticatena]|uniref:Transposase n=1 Tax=Nonomuraea recticatena TaxID=46178 RepID=A0ABN3T8C2_9ACTN
MKSALRHRLLARLQELGSARVSGHFIWERLVRSAEPATPARHVDYLGQVGLEEGSTAIGPAIPGGLPAARRSLTRRHATVTLLSHLCDSARVTMKRRSTHA